MWGGCLFQAGFLALLPLCFSPLPPRLPLYFYLQEGAPRALQLSSRAHWCGKWRNLLSLDLCPVSVSSSWLGWKTTSLLYSPSFDSERSCPGQGGCMGPGNKAAAAVLCHEGGSWFGFPGMSPSYLGETWEHHKVLGGPVCVCLLAGGVVQTSR